MARIIVPKRYRAWPDQRDHEPEPAEADAASECQECRLPTPLEDLWIGRGGVAMCPACYFRTFRLEPLP